MSLEDVAERTDIAKATLYHYFSGKDELVRAVLESLTMDVVMRLETALNEVIGLSYLEQLRALIREQVRILTETAPEVAAVFSWPKSWPESLSGAIKDSRRRHDAIFRSVVEGGIDAGEFDCPYPDVALQCLHGALNQSSLWIRVSMDRESKATLREQLVDTASLMMGARGCTAN